MRGGHLPRSGDVGEHAAGHGKGDDALAGVGSYVLKSGESRGHVGCSAGRDEAGIWRWLGKRCDCCGGIWKSARLRVFCLWEMF